VELTQKLGRILGKGNKKSVTFYDFVDEHAKVLMKHSMARYKALKAVGHEQTGW
jgi:superfamily II DNA or RNA helicase